MIVLVTGATAGFGECITRRFIQQGHKVIATGRRQERLQELKDELGDNLYIAQLDVRNRAAIEEMLASLPAEWCNIDILVNNAGVTKDGLLMKMSEEDFSRVVDINLKGTFNCIRHVSRMMLKQRSGRIISLSSVVGLRGNAGQANYAASKAGIIGLTKSAAKELASRGITVNAIAPGFIKTDMTDVLSDKVKENIAASIPMGSMGTTEDVAKAAAFLASDGARYITGQVLRVDGGMAM